MIIKPVQVIETNSVEEYHFVGGYGERITLQAAPLLGTIGRLSDDEDTAAFFAIPNFNDRKTRVTWFSHNKGGLEPFWELDDARQQTVLEALKRVNAEIGQVTQRLASLPAAEAGTYAQLIPLLLNLPEPVEYHLYLIDAKPVVTHWGMSKQKTGASHDTLTPFIAGWEERLQARKRQAEEEARNAARERSFLGRLTRAGARNGAVTVSLLWNDCNDLDLHVECPDGQTINFEHKLACGGILDIDRNAHPNALTREPVENIVWTRQPEVRGSYTIHVHHYRQFDEATPSSAFELRLKRGSKVQHFKGTVSQGERVEVTRFKV